MSFCPKCGRQLSDGEVCNCQAQNTQQVQPDAQTQSTQQAPKQTLPMVKELTDLLSGIFKKPADAVKSMFPMHQWKHRQFLYLFLHL